MNNVWVSHDLILGRRKGVLTWVHSPRHKRHQICRHSRRKRYRWDQVDNCRLLGQDWDHSTYFDATTIPDNLGSKSPPASTNKRRGIEYHLRRWLSAWSMRQARPSAYMCSATSASHSHVASDFWASCLKSNLGQADVEVVFTPKEMGS